LNKKRKQQNIPEGSSAVIIQRILSPATSEAAELAQDLNVKFIFQVSSDEDVKEKPIFAPNDALRGCLQSAMLSAAVRVVQHPGQARELLETWDASSVIIPNGVVVPHQEPSEQKKFILWSGRCAPVKRPWLFLNLARLFPQEKFVMALLPDAQSPGLYEAIVDDARFLNNLEIVCANFCDIQHYFDQSKILVSTSLYEGFPNTFLQAMAAATPIFSLAVDPAPLGIDQEAYCWAQADLHILSQQLQKVLDNKRVWTAMSQASFLCAASKFDISTIATQYKELFLSLMI